MKVSVNSCNSQPIQQALANSLTAASAAATKMATGEQFQHFFEDPTSNAIGLNMRSDLAVLKTVLKGIEQSQSMVFLAEAAAKSSYLTLNKMKEILAQAKLAYMNNDLIQSTLSPTYIQLKAEINRIADSVNFNGQPLVNGQGGTKINGQAATASSTAVYEPSAASAVNLASIAASTADIVTGISGNMNNSGSSDLNFSTGSNIVVPQISGGIVTTDSAGDIVVTGATLTLNGVTVTDTPAGSGTPVTGTGNIIINNVSFKFAASGLTFENGILTSTLAPTNTSSLTSGDVTFVSTSNSIQSLTTLTGTPALSTDVFGSNSFVTNVIQTYALSGGIPATSSFTFVTGTNLNTEVVNIDLPNLRLTSYNGVQGMINTINTPNNISKTAPTNLTNLTDVQDADTDIPLVEALLVNVIAQLDKLGGYEVRLLNIQTQLESNVQQVDIAQGVFMNADLTVETEVFTVSNVQVNIAISCLKNLNNSTQALQQLVQ